MPEQHRRSVPGRRSVALAPALVVGHWAQQPLSGHRGHVLLLDRRGIGVGCLLGRAADILATPADQTVSSVASLWRKGEERIGAGKMRGLQPGMVRVRVLDSMTMHPEWSHAEHARAVGISPQHARQTAYELRRDGHAPKRSR